MLRSLVAIALVACGSSRAPAPAAPPQSRQSPAPPAPVLGKGCPATYEAARGACSGTANCAYVAGSCYCGPPPEPERCSGVALPPDELPPQHPPLPSAWQCTPTPPPFRADGCPSGEVAEGTSCPTEGKSCNYGSCCFTAYACQHGKWARTGGGCPP